MGWSELLPLLQDFWRQSRRKMAPQYASGRLKQWLALLTRNYPEATALFAQVRGERDCIKLDALLGVERVMNAENGLPVRADQARAEIGTEAALAS
jgi:tRNA-dihydrouridine synthase C